MFVATGTNAMHGQPAKPANTEHDALYCPNGFRVHPRPETPHPEFAPVTTFFRAAKREGHVRPHEIIDEHHTGLKTRDNLRGASAVAGEDRRAQTVSRVVR